MFLYKNLKISNKACETVRDVSVPKPLTVCLLLCRSPDDFEALGGLAMNPIGGRIMEAFFSSGYDSRLLSEESCFYNDRAKTVTSTHLSCRGLDCLTGTGQVTLWRVNRKYLSPDRKPWTFPPLSGFWLISVQLTETETKKEHSRSSPAAGPGSSNVSPAHFVPSFILSLRPIKKIM